MKFRRAQDPDTPVEASSVNLNRRFFLGTMATAGAGVSLKLGIDDAAGKTKTDGTVPFVGKSMDISLQVNGTVHQLSVEPRITLLQALRDHLELTGTKKGCDRGQCGACTVLVDGRRINACLTFAIMHDGAAITTVEGLGIDGKPNALQAAFMDHDAFQCGYCTPGQLCSATALISEARAGDASAITGNSGEKQEGLSDAEIRERMSGNLCRCGAYPNIVAAIRQVAGAIT